jgi:hypothetical protein
MSELAAIYRINLGKVIREIPEDGGSWIAEFADGWTIWWQQGANAFRLNGINPHLACPRSQVCYAVSVSEFSMHSSIAKYTSVAKRWSVAHQGDGDDPEHLAVTGKPPGILTEMRNQLFALQRPRAMPTASGHSIPIELKEIVHQSGGAIAPLSNTGVDHLFQLPALLGEHFFGFRYDKTPNPKSVRRCCSILAGDSHDFTLGGTDPKPEPLFWRRILGR